jgi:hypothetical protein
MILRFIFSNQSSVYPDLAALGYVAQRGADDSSVRGSVEAFSAAKNQKINLSPLSQICPPFLNG